MKVFHTHTCILALGLHWDTYITLALHTLALHLLAHLDTYTCILALGCFLALGRFHSYTYTGIRIDV